MPDNKLKQRNSLNLFLNEHFNWLVMAGVLFIFIFAFLFFIGPKLQITKAAIKDNIEAQQRLYAEQEKKLRDLKTMQQVYDEILPADLARFDGVLPDQYIKETLFGELEEIIVSRGFLLKTVVLSSDMEKKSVGNNEIGLPDIGSNDKTGPVGTVTATISIGAVDYNGLKQLLIALEANSRLFDIKNVSFSQDAETADLEIVTYYFKSL